MNTLAAAAAIDPEVRRQAIDWYVLINSGEATDAERLACEAWRRQHPQHAEAWTRLEAVRGSLTGAPSTIALPALAAVVTNRRTVLKGLAVFAVGAGGGAFIWREQPWQSYLADHRTGRGEQRRVVLADGSQLVLNTTTRVNLRFDNEVRLLQVLQGEVLVQTASLPGERRPFDVLTRHGRIRALGTRFIVRDDESHTQVAVLEHAVEVSPQDSNARQRLNAGQRARFSAQAILDSQELSPGTDAWLQGQLVVNDRPLGEVVAELSRYRRGYLRCSHEAAAIRVSGVFPIQDTDRALAILASRFPIRLSSFSRYWVSIELAA